jgi:hypothetical protein
VIQRTVFFEDGLKIFRLSPLIGRGLGSFENGVKSVQSYYYETKYAHNHYIQALAETGIIGLVLFVGVLVVCAAAILLSRFKKKSNAHPLTPALGAALVFLAGHVAFEVSFSAAPFLPTAFGLFILINLCCGDAIPTPWLNRIVKSCVQVVYVALILVFFCLLCGNMNAASLVSRNPTFDSLETAMEMDKFEWADWMLSYVTSVPYANNDTEILAKADVYAYRLSQLDSNSIPIYLAEYYLQAGRVTRGLQMIEKYVTYTASDSDSWNSAFYVMQAYAVDTEEFREGVARVAQMMDNWNENNIGTITLDANSLAFLESMGIR